MFEFLNVDRAYNSAIKNYKFSCPETFNFAYDVIDHRAKNNDKIAVLAVSGDGEKITSLTYSDLSLRSNRFANGLRSLGLKKGEFACLVSGRVPQWYDALFGCMKIGVISMPGTNLLTGKDIAYRINYTKATSVIVTPEHCDNIDAVRSQCPTLKHFIVLGAAREGWVSSQEMCASASDEIDEKNRTPTKADEIMMGYFTSGTTGMQKMVPRDFAYGLAHAATALFWMDLTDKDIHWTLTDTGWAKAAWGMLFPQFLMGATVVLFDGTGFDAELHLKLIEKLGVNVFCAPPTIYRMFAQMDLTSFDLSSIKRSIGAGEPLNPEVIRYWKKETGTMIGDGYGQTETINIIANFPDQPVKLGSMGKPVPGFEIEIVNEKGDILPIGEIGNIAMKITDPWPPGLFDGYYTGGEPDRTSFRNGWYYTGDTATKDEDGYFWFVGRADDLINSSGYRISPFEVESSLLEHPAVAESAVIGEPDEKRGQIVVAYIILTQGSEPNDELKIDIQNFCKKHTAPYKYPRIVHFVKQLPKTISGKIRRVELRGEG
ncbi:MAG: acyl--CoA ligase [Devosiaceae bacterium]|nr:acyl--CoA ligase [Devosiaceae bacterium]